MAITQTITTLPDAPTRADPANFRTRADSFLDAMEDLPAELNIYATQANSTATAISASEALALNAQADAQSARARAEAAANTATATEASIDQALATVADETASVVAHAADLDAHPTIQERLAVLINAAQDLAGQAARQALTVTSNLASETARIDADLASHESQAPSNSPHAELTSALEVSLAHALQLAAQASAAIAGGRIRVTGGSSAYPALSLGIGAGLYQTADNQLSVVINGSEVARFSATGLAVTGGSVSSL